MGHQLIAADPLLNESASKGVVKEEQVSQLYLYVQLHLDAKSGIDVDDHPVVKVIFIGYGQLQTFGI